MVKQTESKCLESTISLFLIAFMKNHPPPQESVSLNLNKYDSGDPLIQSIFQNPFIILSNIQSSADCG